MKKFQNNRGQSSLEQLLLIILFVAGFIYIGQWYVNTALKPDQQAALDKSHNEIKKQYNDGSNNSILRDAAVKKFTVWKNELPIKYPVARNFVCDLDEVLSANSLSCSESSIEYELSLKNEASAFLGSKLKNDRIYFCGRVKGEKSLTIWGGITSPEIVVTEAVVSDKKDSACDINFLSKKL